MIHLKPIEPSREGMAALQRVLEAAPEYAMRSTGHPPAPADAQSCFTILPPNKGYEDKFCLGIFNDNQMIGFIDLIRGYPAPRTAHIGLLLLTEDSRRKGFGSEAYRLLEEKVRGWAGFNRLRISVLKTNDEVILFWKKMGFVETGEIKPYQYDKLVTEVVIFEKPIVSKKSRYTMRAHLKKIPVEPKFEARELTLADSEELGRLMHAAYHGSIDDEGETPEQFIAEARATLEGKWGEYVQDASFLIVSEGRALSVTVVTMWKSEPLLAYSVTDPAYQGRGMGSYLIRRTMNALEARGLPHLDLGVTVGNAAAEHLYRKLGFVKVE